MAGENHIGEVCGNGRPITVTFTATDTTAYSQYDNVGVNLAVSGATQATPIVITCATHGLADGDPVTITSVGSNAAANVSCLAKVTGYSTVTFGMYSDKALQTPIAGNGAYTSGGTVARLFRIPGAFRKAGGNAYLTKVSCTTNNATSATRAHYGFTMRPFRRSWTTSEKDRAMGKHRAAHRARQIPRLRSLPRTAIVRSV